MMPGSRDKPSEQNKLARTLLKLADALSQDLSKIDFSPVTSWVYNPYVYARDAHRIYLEKFARANVDNVFMGMNPGPWGMAQTGVPFGEVTVVRDWLQIHAKIQKPSSEHPKRPVVGLDCKRSEVSGARLWAFFREQYSTPERFFKTNFVLNYCPLVFMDEGGRNLTPDKFPRLIRDQIQSACDRHVTKCLELIMPQRLIGIGNYAYDALYRIARSEKPLETMTVSKILHPSPASPASNRGWAEAVSRDLLAAGALPRKRARNSSAKIS